MPIFYTSFYKKKRNWFVKEKKMKTSIFGRTIYAASVTDVGCVGVKEGLANTAEFKISSRMPG